jgi:thiosulfate dehydrogenase (quinone) large subunit
MNRIALILVQVVLGYEWLVSGLTKIVHGDFPSGLAGTAGGMGKTAPSLYAGFLSGVVEPHARFFGYAVEWTELLTGAVLLVTAAILLRSAYAPAWVGVATAGAALAGLVLAVNFELANGGGFGLRLGAESFDEGVDLDTVMVALHLALLVPAVRLLRGRTAPRRPSAAGVRS